MWGERGGERDRLLATFVGNVFQRKNIENPLLFLAIGGRKRGGFTPVVALLRQLSKIFFIPLEPSSWLPLGTLALLPCYARFCVNVFLRTCLMLNVNR